MFIYFFVLSGILIGVIAESSYKGSIKYFEETLPFDGAKDKCASNGDLEIPIIYNFLDNINVLGACLNTDSNYLCWIGAKRDNNGVLKWIDGTDVMTGYKNFGANEPDPNGDCLAMNLEGSWVTADCSDENSVVCAEYLVKKSMSPSNNPTQNPSKTPTINPTRIPTDTPTSNPIKKKIETCNNPRREVVRRRLATDYDNKATVINYEVTTYSGIDLPIESVGCYYLTKPCHGKKDFVPFNIRAQFEKCNSISVCVKTIYIDLYDSDGEKTNTIDTREDYKNIGSLKKIEIGNMDGELTISPWNNNHRYIKYVSKFAKDNNCDLDFRIDMESYDIINNIYLHVKTYVSECYECDVCGILGDINPTNKKQLLMDDGYKTVDKNVFLESYYYGDDCCQPPGFISTPAPQINVVTPAPTSCTDDVIGNVEAEINEEFKDDTYLKDCCDLDPNKCETDISDCIQIMCKYIQGFEGLYSQNVILYDWELIRKVCFKDLECDVPTQSPVKEPTKSPIINPTKSPVIPPTKSPVKGPTLSPVSDSPTSNPSGTITNNPTRIPTTNPTLSPVNAPTDLPTLQPSHNPTIIPTSTPTRSPTQTPSKVPSGTPFTLLPSFTREPTTIPTINPSKNPSVPPTKQPTLSPTHKPTQLPTSTPTGNPSVKPSELPTRLPTTIPTKSPLKGPTRSPTTQPTLSPTIKPTKNPSEWDETQFPSTPPTINPTKNPSKPQTKTPTKNPTEQPTISPSKKPTDNPSRTPTKKPSRIPTKSPIKTPTKTPTETPSKKPTSTPTIDPTRSPIIIPDGETPNPTHNPIKAPTKSPTRKPTNDPTSTPSKQPTRSPTLKPTDNPSRTPTKKPSTNPTKNPIKPPTLSPTLMPTEKPTETPSESSTKTPSATPTKRPTHEVPPPTPECVPEYGDEVKASSSVVVAESRAQCKPPHKLLGCGVNSYPNSAELLGTQIVNGNTCVARVRYKSGFDATVQAIARCCDISDCIDIKTRNECKDGEQLVSCQFDSVDYTSNGIHIGTTTVPASSNELVVINDNTCQIKGNNNTCGRPTSTCIKDNDNCETGTTCYYKTVMTNGPLKCDPGYFITGCMGSTYNPDNVDIKITKNYIDFSDECITDSITLYKTIICCSMEMINSANNINNNGGNVFTKNKNILSKVAELSIIILISLIIFLLLRKYFKSRFNKGYSFITTNETSHETNTMVQTN